MSLAVRNGQQAGIAKASRVRFSTILIIAPQPFYEDRGTPIAVRHVLEALSELNYNIDVLSYPVGSSPKIPGVRYIRIANPLGIKKVPIGLSWRKVWFDLFLFFKLRMLLKENRYESIHAVEEAAFIAVLLAKKAKVPIIYDMQSSMAEQLTQKPLMRNALARKFLFACERWLIQRVDSVVSSAGLAEKVKAVIPGACIQDWRYPSPVAFVSHETVKALRRNLKLADGAKVIVYTGNFAAYQGVPLLVDAMEKVAERHPQAVLVLVGAEPSTEVPIRQRLAEKVPSGSYRIIGRQPKDRIPDYLALADVLVSPRASVCSNLPLKILEYLAAGKPVVATANHAHQSVLTQDLAVFVEPTAARLAEGIESVLSNPDKGRQLERAALGYAEKHLHWFGFLQAVGELYEEVQLSQRRRRLGLPGSQTNGCSNHQSVSRVSVIIPARNTGKFIERVISSVQKQEASAKSLEVIVVDDGSTDNTADLAEKMGARVIQVPLRQAGNPALARNVGARAATGDPIIFLDADCVPADGWLSAILAAHDAGAVCVGGSLAMPEGLPLTARWDYFCGWYHVHEKISAGRVFQHPPCNLSICRKVFLETSGFNEAASIRYSHEELRWQAELKEKGKFICFEPDARVEHFNRRGLGQLLRRNFRWAASAIESKQETDVVRFAWAYQHPFWLILASFFVLPLVSTIHILGCWMEAGKWEPVLVFPVIFLVRAVYGIGMGLGGVRFLQGKR